MDPYKESASASWDPVDLTKTVVMVVVQRPAAPLFVVFGATGNQGGSAVDHLVASERQYRVRCLTRSLSSAAARSLAKLGAQLVQVDLDSQAQLETAFASADYVFVRIFTLCDWGDSTDPR